MLSTYEDMFNLVCGDKIGEGIHRSVFECKIRPDLVVKVEDSDLRYFANVVEAKFWWEFEHNESISKWLAPCEYLSPDGRILLQKRCEPIRDEKLIPEKLPAFISDIKPENFGIYEGRFVCVDYAIVINKPSARMQKW